MNNPLHRLVKEAFEAGKERGQDELVPGPRKYDEEITKPDFDEWFHKRF